MASLATAVEWKRHSPATFDATSDLLAAALRTATSRRPHALPKHSNVAKSRVLSQDQGNFQPNSNPLSLRGSTSTGKIQSAVLDLNKLLIRGNPADAL